MNKKAGYVGVVGLPNVGKSTLVNSLIGEKVCITSNKPQTTRKNILGILTKEQTQVLFLDSPGFIQSEKGLNAFLEKEWRAVLEDVDLLIFVFSLDSKKESFEKTLDLMDSTPKEKLALITKTDLDFKNRELIIEDELRKREIRYFKSRRKGKSERLEISGDLLAEIESFLPAVPEFYYEEDIYTTQTMRDLSSEVILENVFRFFSKEVPYEVAVKVNDFNESKSLYKIYADILVSKERYKKIIIGKKGESIKKIGQESRRALEKEFGTKIFMDLNVKTSENWNKKSKVLGELGYHAKQ